MANDNQRQRDQRFRSAGRDQGGRDFRNEERRPYNEDQTYPRNFDREEYGNSFSDDNEHYGSGSGGGEWDRFYNEYDPDRFNPNGGRFGHQNQRAAYGNSFGASRYTGRYFNESNGSGRAHRSSDDLKRDFDQGKGYASYGSSEGGGDYFGSEGFDRNRGAENAWFGNDRNPVGQHRGKGPRGYQRSDERIKEDINDRLYDDPDVDATDIEVSVQKGEVTLTGTVDERHAKRKAEEIAESVSGVTNVENRIRVNHSLFGSSKKEEGSNSNIGNKSSIGSSNAPFGKTPPQ